MSLVGRTVASGSLDVAAGTYFVTLSLPGGQQHTQQIEVKSADDQVTVAFASSAPEGAGTELTGPQPSPDVPGMSEPVIDEWLVPMSGLREPASGGSSVRVPASFDLWIGNALSGSLTLAEEARSAPSDADATIDGREVPQLACMRHPGGERWFALPAWGESSCTLVAHAQPGRTGEAAPDIAIALEHPQANLLLRLRARKQISDEETAVRSASLTSERLLMEKRRDPIAAVVSAYTLLRFNHLERLHDWTGKLFRLFDALPDAAVILGEHLGRRGDHGQALAALLDLERRGLPLFPEGIVLAMDRLTLYARYGGDVFSEEETTAASSLSDRLARFAAVTDFTRQTTTLRGPLPNRSG